MEIRFSCALVLGSSAFVLDTWYPWVFGYFWNFPLGEGTLHWWKMGTVITVAVWSVSAFAALFYICIPGRNVRFNVSLSHFIISMAGSVLLMINLLIASPYGEVGKVGAVLMIRLLHFVFVVTYLRHLKSTQPDPSEKVDISHDTA